MSETYISQHHSDTTKAENANAIAKKATDFLTLAAAPTFAVMALLTAALGSGSPDAVCSIMSASPLSGMVPMYALMSAFHSAPWLKLIVGRRGAGRFRSGSRVNYRSKENQAGINAGLVHRRAP